MLTVLLSFCATIANFDFVFAAGNDAVDNEYAFLVNEQFVIPEVNNRGAFCTVSIKNEMKNKNGDGTNWDKYYRFATKDEFNNKKGDCIAHFVQLTLFTDASLDQLPILTGDVMLINLNGHTLTITAQGEYAITSNTADVYIVNGTLNASGSSDHALVEMSAGSLTFDGVNVNGKGSRRLVNMTQKAGQKLELHMYGSNFKGFKHDKRGGLVLLENGLGMYQGSTGNMGSGWNEAIIDCYDCSFSDLEASCGGVFELEARKLRATFDECSFNNCKANGGESNGGGGAIAITQGMDQKAYFYGCTFKKCTAPDATGGALLCNSLKGDSEGIRVYFDRCLIEECQAEEGGFLGISGPNVEVYGAIDGQNLKRASKVSIVDNVGSSSGASKDTYTVVDPAKMTVVKNCSSEDYGGAICVDNYFNSSYDSNNVKIAYFFIDGCKTTEGHGGAVCLYDQYGEVYDCVMINNRAYNRGGAVYISDTGCKVTMCECRNNTSGGYGGAIYIDDGQSIEIRYSFFESNKAEGSYYGGAIYVDDDVTTISHCRFRNNSAGWGGALCLNDDTYMDHLLFCGNYCSDDEAKEIGHTYDCGSCYINYYEIYTDYLSKDPYKEADTVFYHWGDCESGSSYTWGSRSAGWNKTKSFLYDIRYTSDGTDSTFLY